MSRPSRAKVSALASLIALLLSVAQLARATSFEYMVGLIPYNNGDYLYAMELWLPLANKGDKDAQAMIGIMYYNGQGVLRDYVVAAKWLHLAAAQGQDMAQNLLGLLYEYGHGVIKSDVEAVKWYRLAAVQGNSAAEVSLGQMYAIGQGVPQNFVEAHKWFNLANANKGNIDLDVSKQRNWLEARMTREQIALAQELANTCVTSHYRTCGAESNLVETRTPSFPAPWLGQTGSPKSTRIALKAQGGTFVVPVLINSALTLNFVVDSGAADVSIPADVVMTLMRTETLKRGDFLGRKTYVLADGSKVPSQTFRIRSMKVGDRVVENVTGSVSPPQGGLLLGQSFLNRFKSWSIDNDKHILLLE